MIPYYPKPRPGEVIYSNVARCRSIFGYSSDRFLLSELFGDENMIPTISLPSRLDYFEKILPLNHPYPGERLIVEHTHLPFYAPFMPAKRLEQVISDMRQDRGAGLHMRLGLMASRVRLPDWLRYCPCCVIEARQVYEDGCFWHRLHQLPGVLVCPVHNVWLEDSQVPAYNRRTRYALIAAENAIPKDVTGQVRDLNTPNRDSLCQIALDAAWLLDRWGLKSDLNSLHQRYLNLLAGQGWATYTGSVRVKDFLNAFLDYYSPELLDLLHCHLAEDAPDNWLLRLVRKPRVTKDPLYHLLLIRFLGHTPESFFRSSPEPAHFGQEKWPCLNSTCQHYRQEVIPHCEVHYSQDSRRPVGTFRCECGFVYSRLGPDKSEQDRFRYNRVETFGEVWEATLCRLWPDATISLRELARRLGVTTKTVICHAVRLDLLFPRPNAQGGKKPTLKTLHQDSAEERPSGTLSELYQSQWLELRQTYPDATTTQLRRKCPGIYTWLYRHQRGWLEIHKPLPEGPRQPTGSQVDWMERDIELAIACLRATLTLLQDPGRPRQITISAVAHTSRNAAQIQQHPAKLPVTVDLLSRLAESRPAFAVRRIHRSALSFYKKGFLPQRWQLIKRTGTERVRDWPEVEQALDAALEWLHQSLITFPREAAGSFQSEGDPINNYEISVLQQLVERVRDLTNHYQSRQ